MYRFSLAERERLNFDLFPILKLPITTSLLLIHPPKTPATTTTTTRHHTMHRQTNRQRTILKSAQLRTFNILEPNVQLRKNYIFDFGNDNMVIYFGEY
jgi:hypothetical protein